MRFSRKLVSANDSLATEETRYAKNYYYQSRGKKVFSRLDEYKIETGDSVWSPSHSSLYSTRLKYLGHVKHAYPSATAFVKKPKQKKKQRKEPTWYDPCPDYVIQKKPIRLVKEEITEAYRQEEDDVSLATSESFIDRINEMIMAQFREDPSVTLPYQLFDPDYTGNYFLESKLDLLPDLRNLPNYGPWVACLTPLRQLMAMNSDIYITYPRETWPQDKTMNLVKLPESHINPAPAKLIKSRRKLVEPILKSSLQKRAECYTMFLQEVSKDTARVRWLLPRNITQAYIRNVYPKRVVEFFNHQE
jgi:hypothetical protein